MPDIICKLCKLNKADQTHTPIIPFFLIENMINENREANNINLNASFDDLLFMEKFFKNDVKPINLKKLGRLPVKHPEKTNFKDIFAEDNILCKHCNAKFNMLDELFIEEFYDEFKQMDRLERDEFYYHVAGTQPYKKIPNITQKRIDEILDKINQQGYRYLTTEEKDILKRAAEEEDL